MSNKLVNIFKFIFGWPLSIAAIFFIGRIVFSQSNGVLDNLRAPNLFLLIPGILILSVYFFFRSFIWAKLISLSGHDIPLRESAYYWSLAELKRYIPGFIWTFVGKTISFEEKGVSRKTIASLILVEISLFGAGSAIVSLLSFPYVSSYLISTSSLTENLIYFLTLFFSAIFIFNRPILGKIRQISFLKFVLPQFSHYQNLILLSISVFGHFLFGLGTFLSVSSFFYLPLDKSLALTGLFTLSLLVGYISIVAPMGLGVREGFITYSLSRIMPLGIAGFSSIVARISLIAGELLYFSFLIILRTFENKLSSTFKFIKSNIYVILIFISIIIYNLYFSTISFLRYDNFFTGRFDLGNMDQAVWNTLHGRIFMFTNPDGTELISRLSYHADFLLVLLSPLYLIWSHPKMLLLVQTLILSFGAIFVYLISKKILSSKSLSVVFAISFLLNPSIQLSNLYDFHAVVLGTTFLLGAFYFMIKKSYIWLIVFLLLAGISKEQIWIISALFGAYIFIAQKNRQLGSAVFVFSLFIFYLLVSVIIPNFRGGEHFALEYYSDLGSSPLSIIGGLISSPLQFFSRVFSESSLTYLYKVFLPLGFISVFSPILVFALPDLGINLLSSNPNFRQLYYQYTAVITPFLYISGIFAVSFLTKRFKFIKTEFFIWYILIFTLISAYFTGPLFLSKYPNISVFTQQLTYRDTVDKVLSTIPGDASVSATNNLGSHLAQRTHLYTIPMGLEDADYIAFLLNDQFAQPSLDIQRQMAQLLKTNPSYILLYEKEDFLLFKRI